MTWYGVTWSWMFDMTLKGLTWLDLASGSLMCPVLVVWSDMAWYGVTWSWMFGMALKGLTWLGLVWRCLRCPVLGDLVLRGLVRFPQKNSFLSNFPICHFELVFFIN